MGRRYPSIRAGEWIQPVRRGYKLRCCDCALIHTVDFRIYRGRVQLRAYRDVRATAGARHGKTRVIPATAWSKKQEARLKREQGELR